MCVCVCVGGGGGGGVYVYTLNLPTPWQISRNNLELIMHNKFQSKPVVQIKDYGDMFVMAFLNKHVKMKTVKDVKMKTLMATPHQQVLVLEHPIHPRFLRLYSPWCVVGFDHGLPCRVKNMARGTQ